MRSGAVDAVRVVGITAVVAGHSLGGAWVRPALYTWHVPLFFFLAGYFWSNDRSARRELMNRARSLGVPFLSWFIVIAIAFFPLDTQLEGFRPWLLLEPFRNGETSAMPYTTFWFVSALFFTVMLRRLLQPLPRSLVWATAVAGAVIAPWVGPTLARTPLAIGTAVPCLIFLMLGSAARTLQLRLRRPALLGAALIAASGAAVYSSAAAPVDIKQGNYGTPLISVLTAAAISFGLVLLAEAAFRHLPSASSRAATRLAQSGFVAVLIHPFILWVLIKFTDQLSSLPIFLLTLSTAWFVALTVRHFPGASLLTGTPNAVLHPSS